jgi:hypothetical protein
MKPAYAAAILFVILFLVPASASADLGPKPTVDITVTYDGQPVSGEFQAKMLGCFSSEHPEALREDTPPQLNISEYDSSRNCYWTPASLAWGGRCSDSVCKFNYFLPEVFRLAVFLPELNRTFVTSAVARINFNSYYKADLSTAGTSSISETTPVYHYYSLIEALVITLLFELLIAKFYFSKKKRFRKILSTIIAANIVTVVVVQTYAPALWVISLLATEIFAVVFEAVLIFALNRKEVSLGNAFAFSILANIVSFVVGGFVTILLAVLPFLF